MSELSIFVDESGDFGEYAKHSPYYIVTMVLHDQVKDISTDINILNNSLRQSGYGSGQAIHTEPLIRREKPYEFFQPNERRAIFSKLYYFALNCDIKYKTFVFHKNQYDNIFKLEARIAKDLSQFIKDNLLFFQSFEKVILYYDNGQYELNRILNTVLATQLADYDVRKVIPSEYRLFQVADLICTLELLKVKIENGQLSNSEERIFHSKSDLKKDFLKGLKKKEFL
ncbi:MAG: DUF3800 domain-containing protein [Lachnospiraceae bacterium]|nr:DUF3800 domain-containing protein [Lachnospiraceae bacterium]